MRVVRVTYGPTSPPGVNAESCCRGPTYSHAYQPACRQTCLSIPLSKIADPDDAASDTEPTVRRAPPMAGKIRALHNAEEVAPRSHRFTDGARQARRAPKTRGILPSSRRKSRRKRDVFPPFVQRTIPRGRRSTGSRRPRPELAEGRGRRAGALTACGSGT